MKKDFELKIALFIDFDNIAIGLREAGAQVFDVERVMQRLLEKGRIIFKRAYADWGAFSSDKFGLHEAAIEMIDIPMRRTTGKNSADIRLVVDALDLCYTKEHIDTFVIGSGDSDFSPLVSKLKENDKHVIGFGLRGSTSNLLANNCDEFIFYEDIVALHSSRPPLPSGLPKKKYDAFALLLDAVAALIRENKDVLWGSLVKDTIKRKRPSFVESQFGYSSFSQMLEDAAAYGLIGIIKDPKSGGTPVVTGFGPYQGSSQANVADDRTGASATTTSKSPTLVVQKGEPLHNLPAVSKTAETTAAKPRTTKAKQAESGAEEETAKPTTRRKSLVRATRVKSTSTTKTKRTLGRKTKAESTAATKKAEKEKSDAPGIDEGKLKKNDEEKDGTITSTDSSKSVVAPTEPSFDFIYGQALKKPELSMIDEADIVAKQPETKVEDSKDEKSAEKKKATKTDKNIADVTSEENNEEIVKDVHLFSKDIVNQITGGSKQDSDKKDLSFSNVDVKEDVSSEDSTTEQQATDENASEELKEETKTPKGKPLRTRTRIRKR